MAQQLENNPHSTLISNRSLSAGQEMLSNNGKVKLIMQSDGNLCLYITKNSKCVWDTWHKGGVGDIKDKNCRLVMQTDGNLCLYNSESKCVWDTWHKGGVGSIDDNNCKLIMQDDGNLCLYDSKSKCVWDTWHKGGVGNISNQL